MGGFGYIPFNRKMPTHYFILQAAPDGMDRVN